MVVLYPYRDPSYRVKSDLVFETAQTMLQLLGSGLGCSLIIYIRRQRKSARKSTRNGRTCELNYFSKCTSVLTISTFPRSSHSSAFSKHIARTRSTLTIATLRQTFDAAYHMRDTCREGYMRSTGFKCSYASGFTLCGHASEHSANDSTSHNSSHSAQLIW